MNLRLILKIIVNTRTELLVAKCAENGSETGDESETDHETEDDDSDNINNPEQIIIFDINT